MTLEVTDEVRMRVMSAVLRGVREASHNNLALATGATMGALAILIRSAGGTEDEITGLGELVIARLRELLAEGRKAVPS